MTSLGSPTLDCFQSGSVIQLKSKITNRTLSFLEGGANANGNIGFYAGFLGPKTLILGRWTDGTYHCGLISSIDSKIHIKFNNGDNISHDKNDKMVIVADVDPEVEAVHVGSRVIAQYQGSYKYFIGRVMKKDNANPREPKFGIQFDDGDKGPATLNQLRLIPQESEPISGVPLIVTSSQVISRWTNNEYYRGVVSNVGITVDILFNDGDKIQHDPSDICAVIYDVKPLPGAIQVGSRVIGFLPRTNHFHLAKVVEVSYTNPQSPQYFTHFENGEKRWCNINDLRPVPLSQESVGCIVWASWTNKLYYHGRVTEFSHGKLHILFDDGDKISHYFSDTNAVLVDVVPNPASVTIGSRVIAAWPGQSRFYPGRISEVDASSYYAPRYCVMYDDGDKGWVRLDQIRLLPMKTNQVGTIVWGRWTNNQYYKGKIEKVDAKIHIFFDDGDRIAHSPTDIAAIVLDTTPCNDAVIMKGNRVIAEWHNRSKLYPGTVAQVDRNNPQRVRYYIHYDDGDNGWVYLNQLKLIPVPGPSAEAQFSVVHIGGNVIALRNIAFPQLFLGVSHGDLIGKAFDKNCHFYVHETSDQYISLSLCMFPGQHVGVQKDGNMLPPAATRRSEHTLFEVKLLFSPYGQTYQADHNNTGGHPAAGFPPHLDYPPPCPNGAYPGDNPPSGSPFPSAPPLGYPRAPTSSPSPPGHNPQTPSGGYPAGYHLPSTTGNYPLPPTSQYPPGYQASNHPQTPIGNCPPPSSGYHFPSSSGVYPTGQHPPTLIEHYPPPYWGHQPRPHGSHYPSENHPSYGVQNLPEFSCPPPPSSYQPQQGYAGYELPPPYEK